MPASRRCDMKALGVMMGAAALCAIVLPGLLSAAEAVGSRLDRATRLADRARGVAERADAKEPGAFDHLVSRAREVLGKEEEEGRLEESTARLDHLLDRTEEMLDKAEGRPGASH